MGFLVTVALGGLAYWLYWKQFMTSQPEQTENNSVLANVEEKVISAFTVDESKVRRFAQAIAYAEGYYTVGSVPNRLNNPGDLSPGDEGGYATSGPAEFHSGSNVIHFATPDDGWNALYRKVRRIATGQSTVYDRNWTLTQIAQKYAGDWQNWVRNVSNRLGVTPESTFAEFFNG